MEEEIDYQKLDRFKVPNNFRGKSAIFVQLWWVVDFFLFKSSPQVFYGWRRFLLRLFGARIGKNVILRPSVKITYPWKISIGDNSWIGDEVDLYSLGEIVIGEDAVISQRSYICTGSHNFENLSFDIFSKPIVIEDQAWLATDVFVAPGVRIGRGAVIGARSSVFKDVPGGYIYAGNPLRQIKKRIGVIKSLGER